MSPLARVLGTVFVFGVAGCRTAPPSPAAPTENTKPVPKPAKERPRLVLWLTVDQLRPDALRRVAKNGTGGLARLVSDGFLYEKAAYSHANTETAPGHASLFTGATPRVHGIVSNEWLDRKSHRTIPSVFDQESPLVFPVNPGTSKPEEGRSPIRLRVPTVGDAFRTDTQGRSKVFGVSAKDRGAILPAGQSGTAFWMTKTEFVTSRYYEDSAPPWLVAHSQAHPLSTYRALPWTLRTSPNAGKSKDADARERAFPRTETNSPTGTDYLKTSPFGDLATLDAALAVLRAEHLGNDDSVDLLSVSLSSNDYVGHAFGPESLEAEDNLRWLDHHLGTFLNAVADEVGRENLLVVLSADHGGCEKSETLRGYGLRSERLLADQLVQHVEKAFISTFRVSGLVERIVPPYLYLNHTLADERKIPLSELRREAERALRNYPGLYAAYVVAGLEPHGEVETRIFESSDLERSGDLHLVAAPYSVLLQDESLAATHGSPWDYDRTVPILLFGAGIVPGSSLRPVPVEALAPTVAALAGVRPPAASSESPLSEVFGTF